MSAPSDGRWGAVWEPTRVVGRRVRTTRTEHDASGLAVPAEGAVVVVELTIEEISVSLRAVEASPAAPVDEAGLQAELLSIGAKARLRRDELIAERTAALWALREAEAHLSRRPKVRLPQSNGN